MTTETHPKTRIVLGPIAKQMMLNRAGDEEPHRDHLEEAIEDLRNERNALARTLDEIEAGSFEASASSKAEPQNGAIDLVAKLAIEAHLQLLELRKLCAAGFMDVAGYNEEALLEMERDMTQHQRESLARIGVDLKEFDDENRFHNRELQQQIVDLKEKEQETGEKER